MKYPAYKYILGATDAVCLVAAFWLAFRVQGSSAALVPTHGFEPTPQLAFVIAYSALTVLLLKQLNLYKVNVFLSIADQATRILQGMTYSVLGLAILSFFTKAVFIPESRLITLLFLLFGFMLLSVVRTLLVRPLFLLVAKKNVYRRNALIVGTGGSARLLAANIKLSNPYGLRVLGFLDDRLKPGTDVVMGAKVLGSIRNGPGLLRKLRIAEVLIALDDVTHGVLLSAIELFQKAHVSIKIASPLYDVVPQRLFTERYGDIPVTGVSRSAERTLYPFFKRVFDFVFGTLGLIIISPVFLILAILIKLDSPGPILYRQIRIGRDGKAFEFYKFRSMKMGTDKDEARVHKVAAFIKGQNADTASTKIVDESKVTRIGKFIRRTSMDELPQLLNVLKGDMSLVGPRPCLPYEWEHYEDWHKKRLSVIPGCTGVWQVSARSEVGFDDMVVLDLYYISNASLLLDLQLILKTIPVMLFARGAK